MGEVSFTVFVPVAALIQKHWDDMLNVIREQKSECTHLHPSLLSTMQTPCDFAAATASSAPSSASGLGI